MERLFINGRLVIIVSYADIVLNFCGCRSWKAGGFGIRRAEVSFIGQVPATLILSGRF